MTAMEFAAPPENVSVLDVLHRIGFVVNASSWADDDTGVTYDFGNLVLSAGVFTNAYGRRNVEFRGVHSDARTIGLVDFAMPLMAESYKQVVAWICFGVGAGFQPARQARWFEDGRASQATLPWEQEYRRARERQAAMPRCIVSRDWLRIAIKQLRARAESAQPGTAYEAMFCDGALSFVLPGETIVMPATGPANWPAPFLGSLKDFVRLPKRLRTSDVHLSVQDEGLRLARDTFRPMAAAASG